MPSKDVLNVHVNLTVEGQPKRCAELREAGWRFEFDPETRFVSAMHSNGGQQSVVEILRVRRTLSFMTVDEDEIGRQVAMLLNGGNVNAEEVTR
jgi:hypothetical protein